jgi:3-hydroxyacyl-[acyl-carrier-protein] dehydratase
VNWLDLIPHRHPFLFVDSIEFFPEERKATARWTPPSKHWIFKGHFPDHPILPGVILLEAMAQVACALGMFLDPSAQGTPALLAGADKVRFRRVIYPGETLDITVLFLGKKRGFWRFRGVVKLKNIVAGEAEFLAVTPRIQDPEG